MANKVTFDYQRCCRDHNARGRPTWIQGLDFIPEPPTPWNHMAMINSAALMTLLRKRGLEIFKLTVRDLQAVLKVAGQDKDAKFQVPEHLHDFLHVFEKEKVRELPPQKP